MIAQISEMHRSYCEARSIDLPLNPRSERLWYDAIKWQITPDDVRLVVKHRMKLNQTPGTNWSLLIHRLVGDESDLDVFTNQLAEIKAATRKPVHNPGKAIVLRESGRSGEIEQPDAVSLGQLLGKLKAAI